MAKVNALAFFIFIFLFIFSHHSSAKSFEVSVLYWSMKIEGQVAMRKGFEEEIAQFNKKSTDKIVLTPYVAGEGRKGITNQVLQVAEVLKAKPAAMVIQPTDNSALARALEEANQLKIPVFAYDQYIVNGDMTFFATSDNYGGGRDNGDYIHGLFDKNKELRLVIFEYPKVSSTIDRVDGFLDALRDQGRRFKVLKRYEAVDPASGEMAVKQFLKDFPKKGSVDVIFTVNDGGGLSIIKTLYEKKRTDLVHATFDGDPLSVENIKNGKITVIDSAQFCAELGRETARALIAHLTKGGVSEKKLIPTYPVTNKTLANYPGWMGRVPSFLQKVEVAKAAPTPRVSPNQRNLLTIKIGVAPLCPYLCEQGPGVWGGYIYNILKEVATERGFYLDLESIPNTRLLSALQTRRVNYIIVPADLVRYEDQIRVVGPKLGVNYTGAILTPGSKDSLIDEDLLRTKKVVFADMGTYAGGPHLEIPAARSLKVTGADVADRMIKMIGDRRVEIALGDYNVLRYSLIKKPRAELQLLPTSLTGFNSVVLVGSPRESHFGYLPEYLDAWFLRARQDGSLEKILNKYNLKDWKVFER
ncbi:substrate-binding domain-containing protein [Bdellovibrio bacteriovorus]|uniref:substrate-binding domain-containing protein n=1 Tax=Bdellovibrio bacteriovorus TaxID=959 RepID=UPI0009BD5D62|nr:substrate-binding domain-containing protein [Bdellovibrio bacteriovorus]